MKKECNVVMLSTNRKAKQGQLVLNEELPKDKLFIAWIDATRSLGQNLYITSSDKIKEGDYGIGFAIGIKRVGKGHFLFKHDGSSKSKLNAICKDARKVIATTDSICLGISSEDGQSRPKFVDIPQIPKSFIDAYVKAYNEGSPIAEVSIEMDAIESPSWSGIWKDFVKTRSDNTVIIHQAKVYTREDLIHFATWYSGMDKSKVERAYERYLEETNK